MANTTSGVSGGDWEIDNDTGFVYKRPPGGGLYATNQEEDAPSTPAPAPESIALQRRRRTLLRLHAKYLLELSRWESLSSDLLLAPLPAPRAAPFASPFLDTAESTVLDDHLAEVEVQEKILEKASQLCDEIVEFCNEQEAAIVDGVAALPVWGSPRELVNSLCCTPDEHAASLLPPWINPPRELMDSLCIPADRTVPPGTTN